MKWQTIGRSRSLGISMIEVLVTVLVLSVGMFGVAKLQSTLFQSGTYALERATAVKLAQAKLDDLRSFEAESPTGDSTIDAGRLYFSEISTDLGGAEFELDDEWTLRMPAGSYSTDEGINLAMLWSVADAGNNKDVTVFVAWEDAEAARASPDETPDALPTTAAEAAEYCDDHPRYCVQLRTSIYPYNPANASRALVTAVPKLKPYVGYKPIGVPDAVPVTINVGANKRRETTKPLPDLFHHGLSLRTTIETVDYAGDNNGTEENPHFRTAARTEFATVACKCTQQASTGWGYPPAYYYWNDIRGELDIWVPERRDLKNNTTGAAASDGIPDGMIAKRVGALGDNENKVDPLCVDCCRDHHDTDAPTSTNASPTASNPIHALFDPFRPASDYADGDHKHYSYSAASGWAAANSPNNDYLEACRFVRVDGHWRIFQDWRLSDLVLMPRDNYLETSSNLEAYQSYIAEAIENQVVGDKTGGPPDPADKSTLTNRGLTLQNAEYAQLMARGIYVDRVYSWREGAYNGRALDSTDTDDRTSYYSSLAALITSGEEGSDNDWLERVPFNEVNLTLLGSWRTSDSALLTVTNEDIQTISSSAANYYGTYSRGRVTGAAGTGTAYVTAYQLPSNSGLTGGSQREVALTGARNTGVSPDPLNYPSIIGIDLYDHREDNPGADTAPAAMPLTHNPASYNRKFDTIQIVRSGADDDDGELEEGQIIISGTIRAGNASATSGVSLVGMTVTGTAGATCSLVGTASGPEQAYNCIVDSPYTGTISVAVSSPGTKTYYYSTNITTLADPTWQWGNGRGFVAVDQSTAGQDFWVFGPTAKIRGIVGGCKGQCASQITLSTTPSNAPLLCTYESGSTWACEVALGASVDHVWSGTASANSSTYGFTLPDADGACPNNKGSYSSGPITTATLTVGPRDMPEGFYFCAK